MSTATISDFAYAEQLAAGRLSGSRCATCRTVFVPPRGYCPHCHGRDLHWTEVSGGGKLVAFTCIAIAPPQMVARGYDRTHPYCAAVVELDEGPQVVARIEGVDASQPDSIPIGLRLQITFNTPREGTELVFVPAAAAK